jgi:hypothetical protein
MSHNAQVIMESNDHVQILEEEWRQRVASNDIRNQELAQRLSMKLEDIEVFHYL